MKVTYLNTYTGGGAAVAAWRLADAMKDLGIDTTFFSTQKLEGRAWSYGHNKGLQHYINRFNFVAERLSFLPHEASKAVRFYYSLANFGTNISQHPLIKESDILHIHWLNQGFLSLKNLQQLGQLKKPIIWTFHDMWAFTGGCHYNRGCNNFQKQCGNCLYLKNPKDNDLSHRIWKKKEAFFSELDLTVVTSSRWLRDEARRSSLLKNVPVEAIPIPINLDLFKPLNTKTVRTKLNLPQNKKLLLFGAMSLYDDRKGYQYLKESVHILAKRYPKFSESLEIIIFGKADENEIATLPFKVHALGRINDWQKIAAVYNAADLFIIPSLQDNLPNTIIESLSCGTPVVSFNSGGMPEMVHHQKQGFVAERKNSEELAEGIKWVLEDQNRYEQLAKNARTEAINTYHPKKVAKQYNEVYERVLRQSK